MYISLVVFGISITIDLMPTNIVIKNAQLLILSALMCTEKLSEHVPYKHDTYKWKALVTVAMGTMMATVDASVTNIAFPILTETFHTELTTVMWVTVAYILVSTSSMLVLGKISDLVGRKRIYSLGMGIFTVGLVACSFSQSIGQLICFRTVQALGAAMCVSCGTAIVTEVFPLRELGRSLGLLGVAVSLGFIIGPVVGGFLLHWLDWRSIFYVRAPLSFMVLIMALILLKKDEKAADTVTLDLLGTLISSVGMFSLIFGMSQIRKLGMKSPLVLLLIGIGILFLGVFVLIERHARDPIVDLSLFKNHLFSRASLGLFLMFTSAPSYILIMPFYLLHGLGWSASKAGLLLAVHSMTTIIFGPISGWLSDRLGASWFQIIGALAITAAYFFMRTFDLHTPVSGIVPVLILLGVGVGTFQPPNNSTIMGATPRDRLGTASALIATLRQIGISLGMALAGTLFATRRAIYQAELVKKGMGQEAIISLSIPPAFHDVLLISICIGFAVVILSLFGGKEQSGTDSPDTATFLT
jgi:EmrB/QacA subfamily drug resistance transporter